MYPPVVCSTCSNSLGDIYEMYVEERERRLREYVAQSKELSDAYLEDMILDTQTAIEMGDFLDKLGLEELMCCRTELLTTVLMKQYHE